jgi:hypothetical protein
MTMRWLVLAGLSIAGVSMIAAQPADARARQKARIVCNDPPAQFSWEGLLLFNGPPQQGNGCAPAVFEHGKYVGQDPDANIRAALRRDLDSGYTPNRP